MAGRATQAPTLLCNARVFDGERLRDDVAVRLEHGRIAAVGIADSDATFGEGVDLDGGLLVPGFVDVQVNGGGGALFNASPDVDTIRRIAAAHRRFGTTTLLPTLISDDWAVMQKAAAAVTQALQAGTPGVRGIHFEGPYLNAERRGAHSATAIRPVDGAAQALLANRQMGCVVVTLAPEQVPADFIRALTAAGVRVCAGHSTASFDEVRAAIAAGLCGFTHLFNAMPPLAGRTPGVLGAALDDAGTWCGVIADGHHVHWANLRLAVHSKPPGRVMLVTDAMPSVGAADKRFKLGGETVTVADGVCRTADGTIAGSDLDMATAVRNAVGELGVGLEEALRMASLYPAAFLGLDDRIGRIAPGYAADLALLDDDLIVRATWIAGAREDADADAGVA